MKHARIVAGAALLGGGLLLAGCDAATVDAEIAQIRADTLTACSFVPTAQSVSNILATFVPTAGPFVSIADQVASAICTAANKSSLRRGAGLTTTFYVQNVKIEGKFVPK